MTACPYEHRVFDCIGGANAAFAYCMIRWIFENEKYDKKLKNMCLTDPVGASSSFYDTKVRLIKV